MVIMSRQGTTVHICRFGRPYWMSLSVQSISFSCDYECWLMFWGGLAASSPAQTDTSDWCFQTFPSVSPRECRDGIFSRIVPSFPFLLPQLPRDSLLRPEILIKFSILKLFYLKSITLMNDFLVFSLCSDIRGLLTSRLA